MNKKKVAQMLAIAFGLLMAIPTIGMLTAQATTPSEIVLVDSSQLKDLQSLGGSVLVDYNNGEYLVSLPKDAVSTANAMGMRLNVISEHRELNLYPSQYRFNPAKGVPQLASNLMKTYKAGEMGEYIVQFIGPVKSEWVSKVSNAGAVVERDVAKYGIVVKMTPGTAATVRALPDVAWVGVYEPAYKIPAKVDINSEKTSFISLALYKDANPKDIASTLTSQGITVMSIQKSNVIISIPNNKLPQIAQMPEIEYMGLYYLQKPMDLRADKVIHLREVWYPSYNGLNDRFIGWGQVVGIQDTGYDEGDDTAGPNDHFQGPLGDRIVRYKDETGNSDPDGNQDGVAHGTHCCGLISGNGWSWEKQFGYSTDDYNWDNAQTVGAAPGAKLSIDGIEAQGGGLSPSTNYWDTEQNDGAKIYSNSWGSSAADYDSTYSKTVDDDTDSANQRLIFFAAGNAGPARDTLNPDSQGKDGICVAASRNFRPAQFDSDDPNTIVDFSSRGGTFSDTRIKPDLATPGTDDLSLYARGEYEYDHKNYGGNPEEYQGVDQYDWGNKTAAPDGHPDYQWMSGTSMATPIAAGCAAVIRQYLINTSYVNSQYPYTGPSSQIVKALMINGARRLPNINYPGYDQGWGLVDMKNSLIPDPPTILQYTEANMTSTGTWDAATDGGMALDVRSDRVPLKVTLVWVDTSGVDLNRDLDLYVEAPNGVWYHGNAYGTDGWTMPNTTVANSADTWLGSWDRGDGYDGVNNVEQVEVQYPMTGTWTVHVIGHNVPSTTPFALVVRADIGSKTPAYSFKMNLNGDTTIRVDKGGSVTMPVTITNYGTSSDTIQISDNIPAGFTRTYTYGGAYKSSYALNSNESKTFILTITADSNTNPGVYPFTLTGTSSHDVNVKSLIDIKISVIDQSVKIPRTFQVTNDTLDELDPSILTFTDSSGTNWIFVAYRKPYPLSPDGKLGGSSVVVKYSQLGSDGLPTGWHGPIRLTNLNEFPNDIRMLHGDGGTYQDRVWIIWTGTDPNASVDAEGLSKGSWGRIAWADNSDYSSWTCPATGTNTTIDENYGSQTFNIKRVNSIQYRASTHELVYVFEHLDYDSSDQIKAVHNGYCTSTDGGATWSSASDYDPGGDYFFFPNIMDGGNDYNDVIWSYVYHRASSGNDRDVSCMVYDGSWGGDSNGATKETDVLDNPTNLMFPVVAYDKSSGSTNRVFFAVLNDSSGSYQIMVGYHAGQVSSSNPPPDTSDAWGTVKGPFASSVSDASYTRRPIMNMISTPDDGNMWVQYIEKNDPLGPNVRTVYSSDQFNTAHYYTITADSHPKNHEMSSEVKIGNTDYVYTTYHMSKGEFENVNYDVYVSMYHDGFENDPDTQAPEVLREMATPTTYDSTDGTYEINLRANPTFAINATADDSDTGRSSISSAYWMESDTSVSDPTTLNWSNAKSMDITGNTVIEEVSTMISPCWDNNTVHRIWIKATDSAGNDGYSYIDLKVVAGPVVTISFNKGWNLVSLPWLTSPTSITDALNGLSWDRAMVYQNGVWHTYDANRLSKFNVAFPYVDNTMGIWVNATSAGNITKEMPHMTSTDITLHRGWNLIGYPSKTVDTISNIMSGFTGQYQYIQTYDENTGSIVTLSDTDNMEYGRGYWIYVTTPGTLTVNC